MPHEQARRRAVEPWPRLAFSLGITATVGQNSDRVLAVVTGDRHKFIQNPFLVRSSGLLVSHPDSQHHFLTSRLAQLPLHLPLPPTPAVAI